MKMNTKKVMIWLPFIVALIVALFLFLPRTSLVETMKRESARLFEYEYIPNQQVNLDRCEASAAADSIYKDFAEDFYIYIMTDIYHFLFF